jgi:hypothetical protein
MEKIYDLQKMENIKEGWQKKMERMLKDKIDVTEGIIDFVGNIQANLAQSLANSLDAKGFLYHHFSLYLYSTT